MLRKGADKIDINYYNYVNNKPVEWVPLYFGVMFPIICYLNYSLCIVRLFWFTLHPIVVNYSGWRTNRHKSHLRLTKRTTSTSARWTLKMKWRTKFFDCCVKNIKKIRLRRLRGGKGAQIFLRRSRFHKKLKYYSFWTEIDRVKHFNCLFEIIEINLSIPQSSYGPFQASADSWAKKGGGNSSSLVHFFKI